MRLTNTRLLLVGMGLLGSAAVASAAPYPDSTFEDCPGGVCPVDGAALRPGAWNQTGYDHRFGDISKRRGGRFAGRSPNCGDECAYHHQGDSPYHRRMSDSSYGRYHAPIGHRDGWHGQSRLGEHGMPRDDFHGSHRFEEDLGGSYHAGNPHRTDPRYDGVHPTFDRERPRTLPIRDTGPWSDG